MKNRSLVGLFFVLALGLFATSAFAGEATANAGQAKKPAKAGKTRISSCGLYANGTYLAGEFSNASYSDSFTRNGLGLGTGCRYNNHSRLSLEIGAEFYFGQFGLNHDEYNLKGSVSYLEMGLKEWVRAALNLHRVEIGLMLGAEKTKSRGFKIYSLEMDFGSGWFDFKDFATEHLSSDGELEIWEAGLDVAFPFRRKFSFTFGALWQRYNLTLRVKIDDDGKRVLEALNYDADKVNRTFRHSAHFFYLTPGVKRCGGRWCTSLTVPWGVFKPDKWSWGAVLGTTLRF